jgi:hypothetical protein
MIGSHLVTLNTIFSVVDPSDESMAIVKCLSELGNSNLLGQSELVVRLTRHNIIQLHGCVPFYI